MSPLVAAILILAFLFSFSGCSAATPPTSGQTIRVVAAENFWGSVAAQVGGSHVNVTSIIQNPNTDPHDYEPISSDARNVADAQYVIINGVGYDAWMERLIAANPVQSRKVLNIGDFLGKKEGDNPHFWYNPEYVTSVVGQIRDDLKAIDPADAGAFDQSAQEYLTVGLAQYSSLISDIKAKYNGTPVGATESIFSYMGPALGLDLITPASFLNAVSEGQEIPAADEAVVEQQISQKQIKILVYNSQNTPPNIQILLDKARTQGIPTPTISETLEPATATFQEWQSAQLQGIENALKQATGK